MTRNRSSEATVDDGTLEDLLTAREAAEILGIAPSTLTAYASRGQMPAGRKIGSRRRWTRREIEHHRDHPPRENPARLGRPPGAKDTTPRLPTRRAMEIAACIEAGDRPSVGRVMAEYGVTERTAQRLLQRARTLAQSS